MNEKIDRKTLKEKGQGKRKKLHNKIKKTGNELHNNKLKTTQPK